MVLAAVEHDRNVPISSGSMEGGMSAILVVTVLLVYFVNHE
jgi:hypothetical protein